jgi:hypothetical protein
MVSTSSWLSFYKVLPDGRFTITREKLEGMPPDRVLEATLRGRQVKTLLLDKPFQLGSRVKEPGESSYFLLRIRLRDLEGWPPRVAPQGLQPRFPGALRCTLTNTTLKGDRVEFEIECIGGRFRAWLVDCPPPLLRCVQATLSQDGTRGKKLHDLQEMRLIGAD